MRIVETAGFVPNLHHLEIMRSVLECILATGHVLGRHLAHFAGATSATEASAVSRRKVNVSWKYSSRVVAVWLR